MITDEIPRVAVAGGQHQRPWLCFTIALLAACVATVCGDNGVGPSEGSTMTVTANGRTGTGSGANEAAAARIACGGLGFNSSQQRACEACEQQRIPAGISSWSYSSTCRS